MVTGAGVWAWQALAAQPPREQKDTEVQADGPAKGKDLAASGKTAEVQVVKPLPGRLARVSVQPGTVHAFEQVDVYARVPGFLKNLRVDIGDHVKQGQVLADIESPLLLKEEEQAAIALEGAKIQLQFSEALVLAAEADVKTARTVVEQRKAELLRAKANLEFRKKRYERLLSKADKSVEKEYVDEQLEQLEAARSTKALAELAVATAESEVLGKLALLQKSKADVAGKRTDIHARQAALDKARLMAGFTRIVSHGDGVIARRSYDNGAYVRAADQGEQRPLFTVVRVDRMRIITAIPEEDVLFIEPGAPVDLTIAALHRRIDGLKVSRIGYVTDERTRTMRVEIDVPNDQNALRPGMYVQTAIHLPKQPGQALSLPHRCIVARDGKKMIYVIRDGNACLVPVSLGASDQDRVEVLSGLQAADLVVTTPQDLRGDTVPVRIKEHK